MPQIFLTRSATVLTQAIKPNAGERFSTASKMLHALRASSPNSTATQSTAFMTQATQIITPRLVNLNFTSVRQKAASVAGNVYFTILAAGAVFSMMLQFRMVEYPSRKVPSLPAVTNPTPIALPLLELPVVTNPTPIPLPLILAKPADKLVASRPSRTPVSSNLRIRKIAKYEDLRPSKFPELTRPAGVTLSPLTQQSPVVLQTQHTTHPDTTHPGLGSLQQEIERLRNKYRASVRYVPNDQSLRNEYRKQAPVMIYVPKDQSSLTPPKAQIIISPSPISTISTPNYRSQIESKALPVESSLIEKLRKYANSKK